MSESGSEQKPGWSDRVRFAEDGGGFAYRPGEIVVGGSAAIDIARRRSGGALGDPEPVFDDVAEDGPFTQTFRFRGDIDPVALSRELQDEGVVAQPNHVFFSHCACGSSCPPHPATTWAGGPSAAPVFASPVFASPVFASPVFASPVFASPVFASPVFASPVFASPVFASPQQQATGIRRSSARPCTPPLAPWPMPVAATQGPRVLVLDTGFADDGFRPAALQAMKAAPADRERPDEDGDQHLDPAAGHGTFIAGIIEQHAPGCELRVERVLSTYGDGDEVAIAQRIHAAAGSIDLLNLSFGGYSLDRPRVLAAAVRHVQTAGAVVVSSAGNDGSCRPTLPAALPGVISVGAYGPSGPAPFSNFGPWVRACAPGVDIISTFFHEFAGPASAPKGGTDPDDFAEWARWSGTSFAAPAVVAALARDMQRYGSSPADAVRRVVDSPTALRIPGLGTVVSI